MKENLEELNARGITIPVLLGGAALTRDYAEETLAELYKGPLLYCKDAFDGLSRMDSITGGSVGQVLDDQRVRTARRKQLRQESQEKYASILQGDGKEVAPPSRDNPVPLPPFWGRKKISDLSPRHIFPYINEDALFGQWGYKQKGLTPADYEKLLDDKARPVFQQLQARAMEEGFIEPRIVYGYFPVQAQGDELIVYHVEPFVGCTCHPGGPGRCKPSETPREHLRFSFPRQKTRRKLCISDYFRTVESGEYDVLGLQLVTVGEKATEIGETLRKADRYQDYLYLHFFGTESAEALAEFWHKRMRQEMGFGSEDAPKIADLFRQGYRGSRYSFGYPACPNLEDREKIVELLNPGSIGVALNENFMLVPEQSTDALVVHHPQAKYFDA
jgi:5-methyltetrahydrofolate--homocysteine methyltransferase